MLLVRGDVGILGHCHPSNIPCSSFACGSLKMPRCSVCFTELVVRRCDVSAWQVRNCWEPHLGLGFGSLTIGVWMSAYFLITGFMSAFCVLFSTWSAKVLLIKIHSFFNSKGLSIIPLNEWISLQWQSHSWRRGQAKVTDGNRTLLKQMMSDGSS